MVKDQTDVHYRKVLRPSELFDELDDLSIISEDEEDSASDSDEMWSLDEDTAIGEK